MIDVENMIIICNMYLEKLKIELDVESFNECLRHYHSLFLGGTEQQRIVLDAKPGHGKTTALYCFTNFIINYTDESLLLVFKEKQQQYDLRKVLKKLNEENFSEKMFYAWNSQHQYNSSEDECESQILCITHSRFEKFLIFKQYSINMLEKGYEAKILKYNDFVRKIIIDEEPNMFLFNDFTVNDEPWIEDAMNTTKFGYTETKKNYIYDKVTDSNTINSKEKLSKVKMYFRCMIPFMIAKEHLENTSSKTNNLKRHINDRDIELFKLFFSEILNKIEEEKITNMEFIKKFLLFRELYENEEEGFFTPEQKNNPRTIIISQKINFGLINNSILIMDGTSSYFSLKYNKFGFKTLSIDDLSKYDRAKISIRDINTTSSRRREKSKTSKKSTQEEVTIDLLDLRKEYENIFLICSKEELPKYNDINNDLIMLNSRKGKIENIYSTDVDEDVLSIHLFNTRGKNILNKQTRIYLSSLPIKPPNYYRALAFLLYNSQSLNYKMKKKNEKQNWFSDNKIQEVYENDLLCELIQIFFRTDLRNLKSSKELDFFVASQSNNLLCRILERGKFKNISSNVNEPSIKQKEKMREIVKQISKYFKNNISITEATLGRISIEGKASNYLSNYFNTLISNNHIQYMNKLLEKEQLVFFINESNSYKKIRKM